MKKIRKILPVILMIWPYLIALVAILPDELGVVQGFFAAYVIFTIVVYGFNIWNAFTIPYEDYECRLTFYDMLIKLIHIPFYTGVFMIGLLLALAMVVPAFLLVSPILISFMAAIDFGLMLTSSMYGISAIVRQSRKNAISKRTASLHIVLHFIFVADVISAICIYRKSKKLKKYGGILDGNGLQYMRRER